MNKQKLLVVDDNVSLINMIKDYSRKSDKIEVKYEAYDGKQGLDIYLNNKNDIDLVILDLIMPNKDGLFFLDELQKMNIMRI